MAKSFLIVFCIGLLSASCQLSNIKGNGNIVTENRSIKNTSNIRVMGSINVELVADSSAKVEVVADENLLPYILTQPEEDWLIIKNKENVRLHSEQKIKVIVHTYSLEAVEVLGSGNLKGSGKFENPSQILMRVAGTGSIQLALHTPKVKADITGVGNIYVSGETKNLSVQITGTGSFKGENLLSETADVDISGTGNAHVFADSLLNAEITGTGKIYYKGNAKINSKITGTGKLQPL